MVSTHKFNIDFMGKRKIAGSISIVLVLLSMISLSVNELEWGLDFTGGTLVEVAYDQTADLGNIRSALETAGYNNALVINFGSDQDVFRQNP